MSDLVALPPPKMALILDVVAPRSDVVGVQVCARRRRPDAVVVNFVSQDLSAHDVNVQLTELSVC